MSRKGASPKVGGGGAPDYSSHWTGQWQRSLILQSLRAMLRQGCWCSHVELYPQYNTSLVLSVIVTFIREWPVIQKAAIYIHLWEVIHGMGASFRDAVSLITQRSWVRGGTKSKAPLSDRSQAFLRTPRFSWRQSEACMCVFVSACAWCIAHVELLISESYKPMV